MSCSSLCFWVFASFLINCQIYLYGILCSFPFISLLVSAGSIVIPIVSFLILFSLLSLVLRFVHLTDLCKESALYFIDFVFLFSISLISTLILLFLLSVCFDMMYFHLVQFIFWFSLRIPLWHKDYLEICWLVSKCRDFPIIFLLLIPVWFHWSQLSGERIMHKSFWKNASFMMKTVRERNRGELTQLDKEYLQKHCK